VLTQRRSSTSVGATLKPPVMMSSLMAVDDAHESGVVDRDDVAGCDTSRRQKTASVSSGLP